MERRTLREWFAYLDSTEREITITEFMALMVFNQREYLRVLHDTVRSIKDGAEHSEAMLGAIDELAARLAIMNGLPYSANGDIRAAMAAQRRASAAQGVPDARDAALPSATDSRAATEERSC